jgi:hypothetical protein
MSRNNTWGDAIAIKCFVVKEKISVIVHGPTLESYVVEDERSRLHVAYDGRHYDVMQLVE